MCGICGTLGFGSEELVRRMARRIAHRGPDGEGVLIDRPGGVYLGNRRLAVLDPKGGGQPIWTTPGEIGVVYNGEIYNEPELRRELEGMGHRYRTGTDTETIPRLFREQGVASFGRLTGMFAFALWDARERAVWLVRDQVGIKPLYLWRAPDGLAFASEIKCFLEIPAFRARLNRDALHMLLNTRFIPGEPTLFEGVTKLPPGHWLKWTPTREEIGRYWVMPEVAEEMGEAEAVQGFYDRLDQVVARQIRSDVPVGVYLSGGIDSTLLVAALARRGMRPTTFCLGFGEPTDELDDARRVAQHFGTDHHEEVLDTGSLEDYPSAVYHLEEPKVNGLQGFRLARAMRRHVTVALSGLGGDEVLCGYDIYRHLRKMVWLTRLTQGAPFARRLSGAAGKIIDWTGFAGGFRCDTPKRMFEWAGSFADLTRLYVLLRNGWDSNERIGRWLYRPHVWRGLRDQTRSSFDPILQGRGDPIDRVLRAEFTLKMVDDFLVNGDRMSMASGLEERVPFLDLEMVEFMARVPARIKFQGGVLKWIARQAPEDWLPRFVLEKKKWGFTFDSVEQAKKDLLTVARRELTREAVGRLGVFRHEAIEQLLSARPHRALRWHFFLLWTILGLHYWHQAFVEGRLYEPRSVGRSAVGLPQRCSQHGELVAQT